VQFVCPFATSSVEIKVWHQVGARDPLLYLQLADTPNNQLCVMLFVINDPHSPRFDVDRNWTGERTKFGTLNRNIEAEIAARQAGRTPLSLGRSISRHSGSHIGSRERRPWGSNLPNSSDGTCLMSSFIRLAAEPG